MATNTAINGRVTTGDRLLILSLSGPGDSKVIISLDPVPLRARPLLRKAVEGLMEKRASAAGLILRPHGKAHKCSAVGRMQGSAEGRGRSWHGGQ